MVSPQERVNAKIKGWQKRLIDLSRRNRLLYFRETRRSTLQLTAPSPEELFASLARDGLTYTFWAPHAEEMTADGEAEEEDPRDRATPWQLGLTCSDQRPRNAVETAEPKWRELGRALRNLASRAKLDLDERGVRVLHVAFGMVEWQEPETTDWTRSPLVMVPVDLSRDSRRTPWALSACDEDIVTFGCPA